MNFHTLVADCYLNDPLMKSWHTREDGSIEVVHEFSNFVLSQDPSLEHMWRTENHIEAITLFTRRTKDDAAWFEAYIPQPTCTLGVHFFVSPERKVMELAYDRFNLDDGPTYDEDMSSCTAYSFTKKEEKITRCIAQSLEDYVAHHPSFRLLLLTGAIKKRLI